jgi:hypothetical protein
VKTRVLGKKGSDEQESAALPADPPNFPLPGRDLFLSSAFPLAYHGSSFLGLHLFS